MRMVGPVLFAHAELEQVLHAQFSKLARRAVYDVCDAPGPVSKLRLRRALIQAARFTNGVRLGTPTPIVTRPSSGIDRVEASCRVPFAGDAQLWMLSAPAWPGIRSVHGQVEGDMLHLHAEGTRAFVPWLPVLFAAEIEAIERHLLAQADAIRRYHLALEPRARHLVDQIHSDLGSACGMPDSEWYKLVNTEARQAS